MLSDDSPEMPSAVYVETPMRLFAGTAAIEYARGAVDCLIAQPKREIAAGHKEFRVASGAVPAESVVAAILWVAVLRAESASGARPRGIVLTYPSAWSMEQIATLTGAARLVGFGTDAVRISSEASAAVYSVGELPSGTPVAVVDFGEAAVRVTILVCENRGPARILVTRSSAESGGEVFDAAIRRWTDMQMAQRNPALFDLLGAGAGTPADLAGFRAAVRVAKERLSRETVATIEARAGDLQETLVLERTEYERSIGPDIARAMGLLRSAAEEAGVVPAGLHVVAIGGSVRAPLIANRFRSAADRIVTGDPKLTAVLGASGASVPSPSGQSVTSSRAAPLAPVARGDVSTGELSIPVAPFADNPTPTWLVGEDPHSPTVAVEVPTLRSRAANRPRRRGGIVLVGVLIATVVVVLAAGGLVVFESVRGKPVSARPAEATRPAAAGSPSTMSVKATIPIDTTAAGISASADTAYVVGTTQVWIIDTRTGAVRAVVDTGKLLSAMVVDPATGLIYATASDWASNSTVEIIDPARKAVVASVPVGQQATNIALDSDLHRIYVSTLGFDDRAGLVMLDTTSHAVSGSVPVDTQVVRIVVSPNEHAVYLGVGKSDRNTAIEVLDQQGKVSAKIPLGPPIRSMALDSATGRLFVADETGTGDRFDTELSVVDLRSGTVTARVPTGVSGYDLAFDPAVNMIYVANSHVPDGQLTVVDAKAASVVSHVPVSAGNGVRDRPAFVTVDPATHAVYAVGDRSVWVIAR